MARQWSIWDELNLDYPSLPSGRWRRDSRIHACEMRTAFLSQSVDPGLEIEHRKQVWLTALQNRLAARDKTAGEALNSAAFPFNLILEAGPGSLVGYMIAGVVITVLATFGWKVLLAAGPMVIILLLGWSMMSKERLVRLAYRSLAAGRCGDCTYEFGKLPPERLVCCPECGAPWPAVPPAVELAARFISSNRRGSPAPPPAPPPVLRS